MNLHQEIKSINSEHSLNYTHFISEETFNHFEELYKQSAILFNQKPAITKNAADDVIDEYINDYLRVEDLKILLLIHFCLICESMLNFYGTKKLGEKFYEDNIERVSPISKKIIFLKSICSNKIYDKSHVVINKIQQKYNIRNDFIHPKYKTKQKENDYITSIIKLQKKFNLDEGLKLKKLIKELSEFLVEDEKNKAFHFLSRYNW